MKIGRILLIDLKFSESRRYMKHKSDEKKKVNLIRDTNLVQDSLFFPIHAEPRVCDKFISTYYSSAAWNTQLN